MITFLRRRALGAGSIRGMASFLNNVNPSEISVVCHHGENASVYRNDKIQGATSEGFLVRWGCTSTTPWPLERQLNVSSAIRTVNDKSGFRRLLKEVAPDTIPNTYFDTTSHIPANKMVLRPKHHAQGRNLFVVDGPDELRNTIRRKPSLFAHRFGLPYSLGN